MSALRRAAPLAALGAALFASGAARAQDTCATAYESAQERRRAGELTRARAEMRLCERACPRKLAEDCTAWKREVEAQLASVVLSAVDADGKPVPGARVTIDGAPFVEALTAEPVDVDPGAHVLAFDDGAGGRAEVRVTLAPGERARAVSVRFPPRPAPLPPGAGDAPKPSGEPPSVHHSPAAYVLGAVGLGGLLVGGVLGITGQVKKAHLAATCAPGCNKATQVDPIATEWWAGAAAAIAGGVSLGAATAVWLVEGRAPAAPPRVVVVPGPGWVTVAGRF
jgi:hypothetical protein